MIQVDETTLKLVLAKTFARAQKKHMSIGIEPVILRSRSLVTRFDHQLDKQRNGVNIRLEEYADQGINKKTKCAQPSQKVLPEVYKTPGY
jgi:hypothetical protein